MLSMIFVYFYMLFLAKLPSDDKSTHAQQRKKKLAPDCTSRRVAWMMRERYSADAFIFVALFEIVCYNSTRKI